MRHEATPSIWHCHCLKAFVLGVMAGILAVLAAVAFVVTL